MDSVLPQDGVFRARVISDPERIQHQLQYCACRGWTILIEHVYREGFAEPFWDRWATPVCETGEGRQALNDLSDCCRAFPKHFVRFSAYEGDRMNAPVRLTMLVQAPGSADNGSRDHPARPATANTAIPADCFNAVRTALRPGHEPLIVSLGGKLTGVRMELARHRWRCRDVRSGAVLVTWSGFARPEPVTLHQPVACRQEFLHSAAGTLAGLVLLELYVGLQALRSVGDTQGPGR
ncbi:MAG: ribulose bisphosphate carboxylase small subunit [Arenicellales bacterium]